MVARRWIGRSALFAALPLLALSLIHAGPRAPLSTPICGPITSDTTWTLAASPYVVTCDTTVNAGVTLTVEPGVVVKVQGGWTDLVVDGRLLAQGTEAAPIAFTSYKDDEHGGDTNGDGNATSPAPGDWPGLRLNASSGGSALEHCWIGYGGYGLYGDVRLYTSDVTVRNNTFARSFFHGLYVSGVDPAHPLLLTDNTFLNNAQWAVYDDTTGARADITLQGNTSSGSPNNGYGLRGAVAGTVTFSSPGSFPFVIYDMAGALTVEQGATLTFGPGSVVKTLDSRRLKVNGQLETQGTEAEPVVFTSFRDDAHGGDTNGNGGANSPARGDWDGILVAGEASLAHAKVLYAGTYLYAALQVQTGAQVDLADSLIRDSENQGISVTGTGRLRVSGSDIEQNQGSAIVVDGDQAWVHVTGSRLTGNGVAGNPAGGVRNNGNAVVVLGGEPGAGNAILFNAGYGASQAGTGTTMLATYNWWGDATGPYHPALNPGGRGEEVSDRVAFTPWLSESVALPAGTLVDLLGPLSFSPGETFNLGVQFGNVLTQTLEDAVVIVQLPEKGDYVLSTGGGLYWPQEHAALWRLGDVAPGARLDALVRVRSAWGLPAHSWHAAKALVAATNLPNPAVDLDAALSYTPVTTVTEGFLTAAEIAAELAADPELAALLGQAQDLGFTFYDTALGQTYDDGGSSLMLALLDRERMDQTLFVRRDDDQRTILRATPAYISQYNDRWGWRLDLETGGVSVWGTWASGEGSAQAPGLAAEEPPKEWATCARNWMISRYPNLMDLTRRYSREKDPFAQLFHPCMLCRYNSIQCGDCVKGMIRYVERAPEGRLFRFFFAGFFVAAIGCEDDSHRYDCIEDGPRYCYPGLDGRWYVQREICNPLTNDYSGVTNSEACRPGVGCLRGCCEGAGELSGTTSCTGGQAEPQSGPIVGGGEEPCACLTGRCALRDFENRTAHDPNAKLGPAEAAAGEWISYTVQYENVGAGTAFGVYVEDRLSPLLDEGTLQIEDGGLYFPSSRTIYWPVGELAPGAGGSLDFRVQVPNDAVSGTVVVNSATVYFPSVPEATPTGDVVTLIQDIVAHSQRAETDEGVPLSITLTGHSPVGALTYEIVAGPRGGTLSGIPPDVVYTPAANFEGPDRFTFRVSDGVRQSWPAEVNIVVNTGAETVPPEVWATSPSRDETDVRASETPVYADTYAPSISVYFTEPIDPATVRPQTLFVADAHGRHLAGYTVYDAGAYAARFVPQERLQQGATYTATVTTGVHDTSGNALAADYVWSFTTEAGPAGRGIYLPLVLRRY